MKSQLKKKPVTWKETRSSEEEVVKESPRDLEGPPPELVHTPEQKLVKRPPSDPANNSALGKSSAPVIPPKPSALVGGRLKKPTARPTVDTIFGNMQPQGKRFTVFEDLGKFTLDGQKWELKIDYQKLVVAADRGNEKVALKVSAGQGLFMQENVVAAAWIKILDIKGVTAPEMHLLRDTDIARVLDAAQQKDDTKTAWVRQAVQKANAAKSPDVFPAGSISQLAPESVAGFRSGLELGETTLEPPGSQDQTNQEINEILDLFKVDQDRKQRFVTDLNQGNYDKACVWFEKFSNNAKTVAQKEKRWRLIFLVEHLGGSKAPKATGFLKPCRDQKAPADKFKDWLNTEEGQDAFISMACEDLIFGMEDRVLGEFHPGNFSFDFANLKLWCIDNGKAGPGVTPGADPQANFKQYQVSQLWGASPSPLFSPNLVQHVRNQIIATQLWGDNPVVTLERVSNNLANVLKQASTSLQRNPDMEGAHAINSRVQYVTKMFYDQTAHTTALHDCETQIGEVLSHEPTETTSTASGFKKVLRAPLALIPGIQKAHAAKKTIRQADDLDSLKNAITNAQAGLDEAKVGGQAYKKAQLELEAAQFAVSLHEAVAVCGPPNNYLTSSAERVAVQKLYDAWSSNPDTDIKGLIDGAWSEWRSLHTSD